MSPLEIYKNIFFNFFIFSTSIFKIHILVLKIHHQTSKTILGFSNLYCECFSKYTPLSISLKSLLTALTVALRQFANNILLIKERILLSSSSKQTLLSWTFSQKFQKLLLRTPANRCLCIIGLEKTKFHPLITLRYQPES